jgi:flagellar biosynthesis protein FlhA
MVCVYVSRPLEFSIFPTVLLVTTLLRLTLNVASTRIVLLHGHQGSAAAGQVIRAFGEVVIGGNFVVGMIVFSILMIINFVVVTKGAGRVSEVSARFTLDAMPGKQMSIDSDLNSGIITQDEAKKRRAEVMQEADFYGSMDGASKFVRGDAIAGILILFINLIGGIVIGIFQHNMPLSLAIQNFSLLTIGDGLVAQIPSLLMSISAALMVTRVNNDQDIIQQTAAQLLRSPKPIAVTAAILVIMSLIPSMPHLPFLFFAVVFCALLYLIKRKKEKLSSNATLNATPLLTRDNGSKTETAELGWDEVISADSIALEIGYGLISIVGTHKNGLLINRIKAVSLPANQYRILLKNAVVSSAELFADKFLAINPGHITQPLQGIACKDPTFGLDAFWVTADKRDYAQNLGFTVVDATTVLATNLNYLIQKNASQLLGYDEVQQLINKLTQSSPKLVEALMSSTQGVPMNIIVTVLQRLLQAGVPLVDMRTIAEKLIESWSKTKDVDTAVDSVRVSLRQLLLYSLCENNKDVPVAVLDNDLAQILHKSIHHQHDGGEKKVVLEPSLTERIYTKLLEYVRQCEQESIPAIMLATSELRWLLEKLFKSGIPNMHFLANNEIPDDRQLRIMAKIG